MNNIFARLWKIKRPVVILMLSVLMLGQTAFVCPPALLYAAQQNDTSKDDGDVLKLESPSAVLVEASTGRVIYEKNSNEVLHPASITKIMTLLIIFDALEEGSIKLDDMVTVSEHAASMGGSQVFLEEGEKQSVDTMIKCIAVASGNDASVAMAEHICGTEEAFVEKMNERADELGMTNTTFVNCCGLDTEGHMSTAMDVARMSCELITRYPQIHNYSTIWMDTITHHTRRGDSEFGLTNTNKLIRQYEWATGLKTGSTSLAKCCLSASANKNGIDLVAVIMAAPNSKTRFADAVSLLNYGYSVCDIYVDDDMPQLNAVKIKGGKADEISTEYAGDFSYLFMDKADKSQITKEVNVNDNVEAPVKKGDVLGTITYKYKGEIIGDVDIISSETIEKATFNDVLEKIFNKLLGA